MYLLASVKMVAPSDVWKRYVAFVDGNPEGASELESVVKWIAYGVSGKKRLPLVKMTCIF